MFIGVQSKRPRVKSAPSPSVKTAPSPPVKTAPSPPVKTAPPILNKMHASSQRYELKN